jgi:hypothetical protein
MKKRFCLLLLIYLLTSCASSQVTSSYTSEKYTSITPYIEVENNSSHQFTELNVQQVKEKFEAQDTFILYYYSTTCSYCAKAKEEILIPYMETYEKMIYALNAYEESNYAQLDQLIPYQGEVSYLYYQNDQLILVRPLVQIIENGVIIAQEKGIYGTNISDMLKAYIIV